LRQKIASPLIFLIISILISLSAAYSTEPAQQNKKTLVSLTHSGNDPVGYMLYTMVKHQITTSDNFQLASDKETPIIRLEIITFDPDAGNTEHKEISCGYSAIWISTEGYHIMAAAGVSGRDRLQPVADEILAKTQELIPTAQQHNEKSAEASLRHLVGVDVIKENDELRDRVAELESKIYKLEMELSGAKGKSWWQRFWGVN
jgi:hypothetical protein